MWQWVKYMAVYLCAVAFVMSVGLADSAIDEKARLANELDIKTTEAYIESCKAWNKVLEQYIKDVQEKESIIFKQSIISNPALYSAEIFRTEKLIEENNTEIENVKEYIKKLKAKSTNELIVLYSEGKEDNESFEDIIENAQKDLAFHKERAKEIQGYLKYSEEIRWSSPPTSVSVFNNEELRSIMSDDFWGSNYISDKLYKAELKARQAQIKEEEARIKEYQTKLDIYYTLKANKLKN